MNRRIFYLVLAGIIGAALFIGVIIFPFYKPFSLMLYFNKQYDKSFERYQELYEKKDRSISVVGPLVLLNLQYANVQESLRLMEEYVRNNPNSLDAWQYLGNIYLGADRPHSYLWTLEEIYKLKPTAANIRERIKYYSYYDYPDKLIEGYAELVKNFKPDTWECATLANLYAAKDKYPEALATLDKGLKIATSKQANTYASTLYVNLLIDQGERKEALDFAKNFLKKNPDINAAVDLVNIFRLKNDPEASLELIASLPSSLQNTPSIIETKVTTFYIQGRLEEIYGYLKGLMANKKLPKKQLQNLIDLGMTQENNPRQFENMIKGESLSTLTDSTLTSLVRKAYKDRLPILKEKLKKEIPLEVLKDNFLLSYSLELTTKPITPDELVFYLHPDINDLTAQQKIELAMLYDDVGLNSLAKETLSTINTYENIPNAYLVSLGSLLIHYKLSAEGLQKVNDLRSRMANPSLELNLLWLMLSIVENQEEEALAFLRKNSSEFDNAQLAYVYQTAMEAKAQASALYTSELLVKRLPNKENERLYADALILNDKVVDGLKILKRLYDGGNPSQHLLISYISGLGFAASKDPWYSEEFHQVLNRELEEKSLEEPSLREIGYNLLDGGYKEEAIPIFFELAKNLPYDHPDSEVLRYLWGNDLNKDQVAWVAARASLATGKEKAGWLDYLKESGQSEIAYELIEKGDLSNTLIADTYMEVLATLHKENELSSFLTEILPNEKDLERLKKLGRIANGESLSKASEQIYLKILEDNPLDEEGLREIGIIYFANAEFRHARWYLGLFLTHYKGDYLTYYYMAEMYTRNQLHDLAFVYYLAALEQMGIPNEKDMFIRIVQAQIYYRLNYPRVAICLYDQIIETFPYSKNLRADYGNMLIELDCLCRAYPLLFEIPEDPNVDKQKTKERKDDLVHLENVRTLWLMRANQIEAAFYHAFETLKLYPEEGSAWATRGNLDYNVGLWRLALDDYCSARWLEPGNEDFDRARQDIVDLHRPFILGEAEYRKTGDTQKEHYLRLGGAYNLALHSQLVFLAEQDDIHVVNFTNPETGATEKKKSAIRHRMQLDWIYDYYCGINTISQIFLAKHVLGIGAQVRQLDLYGFWGMGIEYHRPDWNFTETIIEFGSRDRLFVERNQRFTQRLIGSLQIAANRYHMAHVKGSAGDSISLFGSLNYDVAQINCVRRSLGHQAALVLSYSLDAEYATWQFRRASETGDCFFPLGLANREIHTFELTFYKTICRFIKMQGNFGYAYDRFGAVNKADPVYGASLGWDKRPGWTFKILYDHSPSTSQVGQDVDRYLLNISYYY